LAVIPISGNISNIFDFHFNYFDLSEFEHCFKFKPFDPNHSLFLKPETKDLRSIFRNNFSPYEYTDDDLYGQESYNPSLWTDDPYNVELVAYKEFFSSSSFSINFDALQERSVSDRPHYWKFYFFPQILNASFSVEKSWLRRVFRLSNPYENRKFNSSSFNLSYRPDKLYAGFPGQFINEKSKSKLDSFFATRVRYNAKSRVAPKYQTGYQYRKPELSNKDILPDPRTAGSFDTTHFLDFVTVMFKTEKKGENVVSLSEFEDMDPAHKFEYQPRDVIVFSRWLFGLGDFNFLYVQFPFWQKYNLSIINDFEFTFTRLIRTQWIPSYIFTGPHKLNALEPEQNYSMQLEWPDYWRTFSYPFQQNDISEYYYLYANNFALNWMSFKPSTYSNFVLKHYPTFLSSDSYLSDYYNYTYTNPNTRHPHDPRGVLPPATTIAQIDFKKMFSVKSSFSSHDLFYFFYSIKYFYFFYINAFIRSVTYFFSFILVKSVVFFDFFELSPDRLSYFTRIVWMPQMFDRAAFHQFLFYVVKIDQFFYLTNGWYPYHYGRLSRYDEGDDYTGTGRPVLRVESIFENIMFYLLFLSFYTFFFFELLTTALLYPIISTYFYETYVFYFITFISWLFDFCFFTPWFSPTCAFFVLSHADSIITWVICYSILF
jgi:hypothetical protein